MYSLDAKTGKPDPKWGVDGRIDFRTDLRGGPEGTAGALGHPPVIYKDLVIFAGRTGENLPVAPGDIRAYDARTGKLRWTFHTVPHPGEFGYDTWPKDAWTYSGNVASWQGMSLDEQRGIVYVATANPVNMFIGRDRLGDNLFGNYAARPRCEYRQADLALPDREARYLGPRSPFASLVDHRQTRRQER